MATLVPDELYLVYTLISPHLASDQRSGIANSGSPGYHTSRADLIRQKRTGDYSVQCPADRRGDPDYAAGMDITLNATEMRLVTTRLRTACTPNALGVYDPRIECLREFIGSLDGRNVCGYNRVATGSASRSRTGWFPSGYSDSSHRWHVHLSVLRDRVENENEMRGLAEVIAGVKAGTFGWTGSDAVPPVVAPPVVPPYVWDGKAYPGPQRLTVGAEGPWVAWVGDRLRVHGIPADPGNDWTQSHTDGVIKFKRAQGWSGGPTVGEATWDLLAAAPKPVKPLPTYTVQTGDTLSSIAARIGVAWQDIAELNPTVNPHKITPGLVLTVPKAVPAPKQDPKPTPPKGDTVPEISVVDINVLRRTDPEAGKTRLDFDDRLAGLVAAIKAGDPVLVFLQELDLTTATKIVTRLGSSWTWERKNGIGIAWDQDVLERTGDAIWHLFTDRDNRYLLSVPFRHEKSGVEFWADVTHLENDGGQGGDAHAARFLQATETAARTGKGMRILGGDFNSTSGAAMPAKPTTRERQKPRRVLAGVGWSFLSSIRSGIPNGKLESHWGGRKTDKITEGPWIDDLAVRGGARIVSGKLLRTDGKRATDHHALQATVALGKAS